jgi:hypothetical protein
MSKFEELIEQAEEGNMDALAQLKAEFSGSALREKAEKAAALQEQVDQLAPFAREAKIKSLKDSLPEQFKNVNLTSDDLVDVAPSDITLETLIIKAQGKQKAQADFMAQAAKMAGFDNVEEYQKALDSIKRPVSEKQPNQTVSDMEKIATAATGTASGIPDNSVNTRKLATETYKNAKQSGRADDYAIGEAIEALFDNQLKEN